MADTLPRLAADLCAAASAAICVAPIICIIDQSIMENASGKRVMMDSVMHSVKRLVTTPHKFFISKPFGLIFMVYSGTYLTANLIDTGSAIMSKDDDDIKKVTAGASKLAATSTSNIGLGLIKDRSFTRMFGTGKARALPAPTYALFCARDSLTIFFSFNVPPLLSKYMPEGASLPAPSSTAQFLAPAGCQLISTPLHLLGLDLYNRHSVTSYNDRWRAIKANYWKSAGARICRIVPAFGVGGVVNAKARYHFMSKIEATRRRDVARV